MNTTIKKKGEMKEMNPSWGHKQQNVVWKERKLKIQHMGNLHYIA